MALKFKSEEAMKAWFAKTKAAGATPAEAEAESVSLDDVLAPPPSEAPTSAEPEEQLTPDANPELAALSPELQSLVGKKATPRQPPNKRMNPVEIFSRVLLLAAHLIFQVWWWFKVDASSVTPSWGAQEFIVWGAIAFVGWAAVYAFGHLLIAMLITPLSDWVDDR